MTEEKYLLQKAEAGDIDAIKTLADYYDKKSGRWQNEPNLGESISIKEFLANRDKEIDEECLEKAFKFYLKAAELGDPQAMYEVGRRIYDKKGYYEEEDWNKRGKIAFDWYLKSAQAGYAPAMRITAYMYGGLCVEKNEAESFRWYLAAAKNGDKKSVCEVAKYYAKGIGTEKNLKEADKWLAKLDKENYTTTLHELSNGDDEESLMWLERLVEQSDPLALKKKAEACCKREDYSKALELFIKAGTSDLQKYNPEVLAEALFQAGNLYYTGEGDIEQSYKKAFKYYRMAADRKYIKACVQCGKMYYKDGIDIGLQYAMHFFKTAINTRDSYPFASGEKNTVAFEYIGRIYERKNNLETAYRCYEAAAQDSRNHALIFRLANDYFYGNKVAPDINKALSYYEEAGKYKNNDYYFEANLKLAWIYELGQNVEKDLAKADEYWEKLPPEFKPART